MICSPAVAVTCVISAGTIVEMSVKLVIADGASVETQDSYKALNDNKDDNGDNDDHNNNTIIMTPTITIMMIIMIITIIIIIIMMMMIIMIMIKIIIMKRRRRRIRTRTGRTRKMAFDKGYLGGPGVTYRNRFMKCELKRSLAGND